MLQESPTEGKQETPSTPPPASVHCLIELCSDGFVKAYGPKQLHVAMVTRPKVRSSQAGNIVDNLYDEILPRPYKDIFYPSAIRCTGQVKRLTVDDLWGTVHDLAFLERMADREPDTKRLLWQVLGASR